MVDSATAGGDVPRLNLLALSFFWVTCYVTGQNNRNNLAADKLVSHLVMSCKSLQLCQFLTRCMLY